MHLAILHPALPRRAEARTRLQAMVQEAKGRSNETQILEAMRIAAVRVFSPTRNPPRTTRSPITRGRGLQGLEKRLSDALLHIDDAARNIDRSATNLDATSAAFDAAYPGEDHGESLKRAVEVLDLIRLVTPSDMQRMSPVFRDVSSQHLLV